MARLLSNTILLSKTAMYMTTLDRNKQELSWYAGGIYLCTHFPNGGHIADEIEAECKRRKIPFKSILVKERSVARGDASESVDEIFDYDIRKVAIPQSPETTALEKKQMADWAVTTFNNNPGLWAYKSYSYAVWIQPSSDVGPKEVDDEFGIETHWVEFR